VWQVRERFRYDAEGWAFARRARGTWDLIQKVRPEIHNKWIVLEREQGPTEEVKLLKEKEAALLWVLEVGGVDLGPTPKRGD
jgi:hypothetical protein